MNCEHYELMIALYIEDDLPASDIAVLESHLCECGTCQTLMAEMSESQRAVKAVSAEALNEAVLVQIRANVMGQIRTRRVSLWERLTAAFHWRFAVAGALLAAIALPLYLWQRDQAQSPQQLRAAVPPAPVVEPPAPPQTIPAPAQPVPRTHDTMRKKASDNARQVVARRALPESGAVAEAASETSPLMKAINDTSLPDEKIKVEIKTADPQIRIIWFIDKEKDRLSPA